MSRALAGLAGLAAAVLMVAAPAPASAQPACARPVALFESVRNNVQLVQVSTKASRPATRQVTVCAGDVVRVGDNSRAVVLILSTNAPIALDQNTELVITESPDAARSFIDLLRGALLFISRVRQSLEIRTPFVNAAVEGTEFVVRVLDDRSLITVFEGAVRATTTDPPGMVLVGPGQQAVAVKGQPPQLQVIVRPRDAVQWALYYEPVLAADSFAQLEMIPETARDAAFYVRRAGLLLGAGQLAEAQSDLDLAQKLDPANGDAYALRAIVSVALNDREGALTSGRTAVERAPRSPSAQLALSYALQANIQLEAARDVVTQATEIAPDDGAVWARLAELRMMLDDVGGAVEAARRAAMLSPELARPQTVLGFTLLAQLRPADARGTFERAIDLEPDNPLARLGLGLAKIRQGDLAEGRGDIELAMAHDPASSLIRSYLGKAYFDERREPLPGEEFELAKQLDPMDPTPWFYDAIRKQTINRPVEALQDLQRAIVLNDNRAVYRSQLFLDADLAARSASLGRIYRDLGFEQLALIEGWKSLVFDAGEHSGHRYLSDVYSVLPRHEVARVSELLQAQLLQPLSIAPVPPTLAETDLFILEGAGPSEPAFNEFNQLFVRNSAAAQFSGVVGQRSVRGEELTASGVWNRLSFSIGQFHYEANGFRENNAQDRDLSNAFIQARLSPSTSIQAEYRFGESVTGDLNLLFDAEAFFPDERIETRSRIGRVGVRHVFSPNSQVIASVYVADDESDATSSFLGLHGDSGSTASLAFTDSGTAEVRHLFRFRRWFVTSGGGHFQSNRRREERFHLERPESSLQETPELPLVEDSVDEFNDDPRHTNFYSYSSVDLSPLTLTFGAGADFYRSNLHRRSQFNPKFGLVWNPQPATTLRFAAFRTLQRPLVASQTIEPTQFGGFNQFFTDDEAEEAWRYGVAVDRRFSDRLFGGLEYSWRDLSVPIEIVTLTGQTNVTRFDRSEQLGRSYVYWAYGHVALSAEYVVERFDRTAASSGAENILELRTHRLPLAIRYFNPDGWFAGFRASYVSQKGEFADLASLPSGQDSFWVVDTTLGYRLPKRYGRLAFEVKNLFDEQFQFQDTDPGNPVIKPGRLALVTFTFGVW